MNAGARNCQVRLWELDTFENIRKHAYIHVMYIQYSITSRGTVWYCTVLYCTSWYGQSVTWACWCTWSWHNNTRNIWNFFGSLPKSLYKVAMFNGHGVWCGEVCVYTVHIWHFHVEETLIDMHLATDRLPSCKTLWPGMFFENICL